ncbi:MYO6 protein [Dirofilaria immitis]|nr:MYO6 protein [Dirofilaria immitis]
MEVEVNMHIWAPDDKDGFILCKVIDIGCEWLTLQRLHGSETVRPRFTFRTLHGNNIFPAGEDVSRDVDDNCSLIHLNDSSLLNNCRLRYNRKQFYTYVANILIAINPYEHISGLYNNDMVQKYKGQSLGTLPPHIFAIADKAYRDMMRNQESQSIIISGESGAGKTESQKYIIRFLCESWGHLVGTIEQRILEVSTILESFGNAKTACNNNSSRFGKFVEIYFSDKGIIVGGFVSHYLLERSRLCGQNACERNYHIFYQLIAGADNQMAKKLRLNKLENFNYLNKGCMQFFLNKESSSKMMQERKRYDLNDMRDNLIDDYNDFQKLLNAFNRINVSANNRDVVFETVAAILHLGNIEFLDETIGFKSGCNLKEESDIYLINAAELLGIEVIDLRNHLVTRLMQPTRGGIKGTLYAVPLSASEATAARDALAKAIYSRLFTAIVDKITECMPFAESAFTIGVLDTAGFELFDQKLYGIFELLDNESRLPRSSTQHFTTTVHEIHTGHPCLMVPRLSHHHRTMRDDEGFIIRHYAADVCYDTAQFLDKNNDTLHASLQCLMQQSKKSLICELFADSKFSSTFKREAPLGKLMNASVGNKFRLQLDILLAKLRETGTHFVRCIKPNSEMKPNQFNGAQILLQLRCSGMSEVLKVMQRGFPSRVSYLSLYNMYQKHLPSTLAMLDAQLFCKLLHQDKRNIGNLIKCMSSWLCRFRFRRIQFAIISLVKGDTEKIFDDTRRLLVYRAKCRIRIQNAVRAYIVYKSYRPRINALLALSKLTENINDMHSIANNLSETDLYKWTAKIDALKENVKKLQYEIRHISCLRDKDILHRCNVLENDVKEKLKCLKHQAAANELLRMQGKFPQKESENSEEEQRSQLKKDHQINEQEKRAQQETLCLEESVKCVKIMKHENHQLLENRDAIQACDLSKWLCVDIRNGINSNDPKLSTACKNEYYRRMRAYNDWKERNMISEELTHKTRKK